MILSSNGYTTGADGFAEIATRLDDNASPRNPLGKATHDKSLRVLFCREFNLLVVIMPILGYATRRLLGRESNGE